MENCILLIFIMFLLIGLDVNNVINVKRSWLVECIIKGFCF